MTKLTDSVGSGSTQYATAMIGGQLFGLPISRVQDVFMPERLTRVPLAPDDVAGVLNLTVDHLARHGSMQGYADTKARIFMCQQPGDAAVLNADDPLVAAMTTPVGVERFFFSLEKGGERTLHVEGDYICCGQEPIASMEDNPLPGRHNLANVLACLAVMKAAGFPWEGPLEGLRSFKGVEHRIEFVLKLQDVDYYNDSKSTNMDSLRVALQSFSRPVVLIAGGRGKGGDYTELNALVKKHVKHLVLIGEDAPKMEAAFGTLAPATRAGSMRLPNCSHRQHNSLFPGRPSTWGRPFGIRATPGCVRRWRRWAALFAAVYAAVVALGVIIAGWHFISDVIGAILVVGSWAALALAALVEQAASAAESMKSQAAKLSDLVSVFRLSRSQST